MPNGKEAGHSNSDRVFDIRVMHSWVLYQKTLSK
jgi:hypothetical protein